MKQVQANNNTVRLDGIDLPVEGDVRPQNLARLMGKVTFGDYSQDSDPLQSVMIWSSFTGGIGNEILKEGVDDETYWTGTLETRYPGMVTLPALTHQIPGPVADVSRAYPVADFPARAPSLWCAFGSTLARWNEAEKSFGVVGLLSAEPANKGVEYNNLLWIPLGLGGYATVNDIGELDVHDDLHVVAFTEWDNKIAALTYEGVLRLKYKAMAWEAEEEAMSIPSGHLPRNLVVFMNQQQDPTIHIVTNKDVWAFDRETSLLFRTNLQYPRHPDQGTASTVWRGETMYVSVGLGIHGYTGGIITSMGPDGRYGLPARLRGRVTSLEPEYNALIAVIEGARVDLGEEQEYYHVRRQYQDDLRGFPDMGSYSSILRFNGYGWHPVWTSPDASGLPTWAHVSEADNTYRLWWGYGSDMYYQDLPVTFHNPKAGMQVGESDFAPTGSLTTGWFDADMIAFHKLNSHCEINTEDVFSDGTPGGAISLFYQRDTDTGWHLMGTTDKVGRAVFPFNVIETEGDSEFSAGLLTRRIRFRLDFTSNDPKSSPVMRSFLLKFIKTPLSNMSWTFEVDLNRVQFMGRGVEEIADHINSLAYSNQFCEFIHRDHSYRARVAQVSGSEEMGVDPRSRMTISLVEIPLPEHELREPTSGS